MNNNTDYFLYSGPINRYEDFDVIESISKNKKSDAISLILCTNGGSPDAAYKIGIYLQSMYEDISILIPGICKSAGTLLAISGKELVFCPYGELGPLDVQMSKQDHLFSSESGLNIAEALNLLEVYSRRTFHTTIGEIVSGTNGVVSFATAVHSAAELVKAMYAPMFGQIDPEEVGSRSRAMRVGELYGNRLDMKFKNLKDQDSMEILSRSYASHGFVINKDEAKRLFNHVRQVTDKEQLLVDELGKCCRFPNHEFIFKCVSDTYQKVNEGATANGNAGTATAKKSVQGKTTGGTAA